MLSYITEFILIDQALPDIVIKLLHVFVVNSQNFSDQFCHAFRVETLKISLHFELNLNERHEKHILKDF